MVGVTLPASFNAAATSAQSWIDALAKQKDGAAKAEAENAKLDAIIEAAQEKLKTLADGFDAFWDKAFLGNQKIILDLATTFANSLQSMHDEVQTQVPIITSIFSQLPLGLNLTIGLVFKQIEELNKAFGGLGVETDSQSATKVASVTKDLALITHAYDEGWRKLNGDYLVSSTEMLNAQVSADQVMINEAHRTGQALSDSFIHSFDDLKAKAVASSMDIDQAFSTIGSKSTAQWTNQLAIVDAAFTKISGDATSSLGDMQRAQLADLQTMVSQIQSSGQSVSTTLLNQISTLQDKIKSGNAGLLADFDQFAGAVGADFQKASDQSIVNFMTGQGSLGQVWNTFLTSLATDFEKIFIGPITSAIAKFVSGSLASLIGGQGLGGITNQANILGQSLQHAFSLGTTGANSLTKALGGSVPSAAVSTTGANNAFGRFGGNNPGSLGSTPTSPVGTSVPDPNGINGATGTGGADPNNFGFAPRPPGYYDPTLPTSGIDSAAAGDTINLANPGLVSSGSGAAGAGSGSSGAGSLTSQLGSLTNIIGLVGVGVQAISGIVSGVQQAHANSLLDKIEKSTRGMLNVLATNGTDSILHYTAATSQYTMDTRDRVIDIRSALFDPVAKDLEAIWLELNAVILPAINTISGGVGATVAAVGASSQTVADGTAQIVDGLDQNAQQVSAGIDTAATINADGQANLATDLAQSNATAAGEAATTYGEASQTVASAVTSSGDQITGAVLDTGGMTAAALGNLGATLSDGYDSIKAGLIGQPVAPNPSDIAANNKDLLSGNPYGVLNPDGSARDVTPDYTEKGLNNPTTPYTPTPYTPASTNSYTGAPGAGSVGGGFTTHTGVLPTTPTPYTPPGSGVAGPTQFTGGGAFDITPYTGIPAPYTPASTNSYTGAPGAGPAGGFTDEFSAPTGSQLTSADTNNALNQYLAKGGTLTGYYSGAPLPTAPPPPPAGANQYGEVNPYENEYAPGIPVTKSSGPIPNNITIQMNNSVFSNQAAFEQFNAQLATTLRQNVPS